MNNKKLLLIFITLFFTTSALAYIDPGMGSMWIQTTLAVIAGLGVSIKMYWSKLKLFFFKNKKKQVNKELKDKEN